MFRAIWTPAAVHQSHERCVVKDPARYSSMPPVQAGRASSTPEVAPVLAVSGAANATVLGLTARTTRARAAATRVRGAPAARVGTVMGPCCLDSAVPASGDPALHSTDP